MSRGEPPITKSVRAGVCQLKLRRKDVMLVSMYCYMFVFSIHLGNKLRYSFITLTFIANTLYLVYEYLWCIYFIHNRYFSVRRQTVDKSYTVFICQDSEDCRLPSHNGEVCMWAPVISLDIVKFAQRIGCLQVHIGDDSLVLTDVISLCGGGCDGGPAWFSWLAASVASWSPSHQHAMPTSASHRAQQRLWRTGEE